MPSDNVLENLTLNHPDSPWFNNTSTAMTETMDDILKRAIVEGIAFLAALDRFTGIAPSGWRWGAVHKIHFGHLAGIAPFSRGPYEADGSMNTVNPTYGSLLSTARGGASQRLIIDFSMADSNFNTSLIVIPGGSSGNPISPHYDDELTLFLNGTYHPLHFYPSVATFPAALETARIEFTGGA